MIKLLLGQTGIGKTKEIIDHANEARQTAKGDIVFINESNECMLELNHDIRYINISEFPIQYSKEFIAFILGLLGSNYDIEKIYLDGILNVFLMTPEEICTWLDEIKKISDRFKVAFEITLSYNGDIPECFKTYL